MNNIDKVAEVIAKHNADGVCNEPECIANDLADAGLLAPNLPKPTTIAEGGRGATWGRDVQVWVEDGGNRVWVEMGDMTISYTVESARKHGNRLLAAANLAAANHAEGEA